MMHGHTSLKDMMKLMVALSHLRERALLLLIDSIAHWCWLSVVMLAVLNGTVAE